MNIYQPIINIYQPIININCIPICFMVTACYSPVITNPF